MVVLFILVLIGLLVLALVFFPKATILGLMVYLFYRIYLWIYFKSSGFKGLKESISKHIDDCNQLNDHIEELKSSYINVKARDYGTGVLNDESRYNFKRKDWGKNQRSSHVHNCSATVCKNASEQPFKYLCKYFDIKTNEETLAEFEAVLNDFAAAEQGKTLLMSERESILQGIKSKVPFLIFKLSRPLLVKRLGFETVDLTDLYFPVYTFQYVSAGGNSSTSCNIKLDVQNLNKFVDYLSGLVKFRSSIAGQRALMTSKLREKIKERDNFTCKTCNLSTRDERNLLLEIDHILPLSKGGITSEQNLQTLCWRCNRSKGSKILAIEA